MGAGVSPAEVLAAIAKLPHNTNAELFIRRLPDSGLFRERVRFFCLYTFQEIGC